jgi:uncharacterized membrane protein YkvA (DUF1232 family)
MKVFISHSSLDKIDVQNIKDMLPKCWEVWYDLKDMQPGDIVDDGLHQGILWTDFVLVFWSANSAASEYVAKEIRAAVHCHRQIVVCRLDGQSLGSNPHIKGAKWIDFANPRSGLTELTKYLAIEFSKAINQPRGRLDGASELSGLQQQILEQLRRGVIQKKDYPKIKQTLERMESETQQGLEEYLQELLGNVERTQREIDELDRASEPATRGPRPRDLTNNFSKEIASAARGNLIVMHSHWQMAFGPAYASQLHAGIEYYLSQGARTLEELSDYAQRSSHHGLQQACIMLFSYIISPQNAIPDSTLDVMTYLDDVWLVHNAASYCLQAGIVPNQCLTCDWNTITHVDRMVVESFEPTVKQLLLQAYTATISAAQSGPPTRAR